LSINFFPDVEEDLQDVALGRSGTARSTTLSPRSSLGLYVLLRTYDPG
jgi:hypothetical protein